jgi:DNA-binding response OmpR family regulator
MAMIVLIQAAGTRDLSFLNALKKRYAVLVAQSGKQGLALAREHRPSVVVLDAISLRTPGNRVCEMLHANLSGIPIIHMHPGPEQNPQSPADVILVQPFTWRKLINSVERLLAAVDDKIVSCGPFSINVDRHILMVQGQETALTPKQASLIEIFLRHPGETLSRKTLMEKVWDTDYMGDTRTLDVHIRWIRQVLENDARHPRYLKTVRGVGYRFEMP